MDVITISVAEERTLVETRKIIGRKIKSLFPKGCKRILFVSPHNVPEEDFSLQTATAHRYPVYPPRGLAVLNADVKRRGYVTAILDLNLELQLEAEALKERFVYRIWENSLHQKIEEFNPDVVVLSCMFTIYHRNIKRYSASIKGAYPDLPIFAGGVHVSAAPELVLKDCPAVDIVGLFEGDVSFGDSLDYANNRICDEELTQLATLVDGAFFEIRKRAVKTADSLDLMPDYEDLSVGEYSKHTWIGTYDFLHPTGTRAATALANVGCRAHCTFCSVRSFNGKGVALRSESVVVDELLMLRDTYGISHFMWLDDDLLYNKGGRAINLFNEMVRRQVGMTWDASNGIIASAMTEEIAAAASESGCIGLSIGIESGNPEILKSVRKPSGVKHFIQCAEILKKYPHIFVRGLLMCGFPGENVRQILDTKMLGEAISLDWCTVQPLVFIPGVDVTKHALESGLVTETTLIDGTERPTVGSTGKQSLREIREQKHAQAFENPFEWDSDRVPTREEIRDVWFMLDYSVNYARIAKEENPIKLDMLYKFFTRMCNVSQMGNALAHLYFSIIERKLGHEIEARRRLEMAQQIVRESEYWQIRFSTLFPDGYPATDKRGT